MTATGVLRINIWLFIPVPKIKFDPPPQGKSALVLHILGISLNRQFFSRCGNFIEKMNFVSTPWKIKIPLGKSVEDHIWTIQMHLGG